MENEEAVFGPAKKAWSSPALEILDLEETAGSGGGGPDFGSELS